MNKSKIIILVLIIVSIISIFNSVSANANYNLLDEKISGVYYSRRGGNLSDYSGQHHNYTMSGKTAYCIEPGIGIFTSDYIGYDGLMESPYDEQTNKAIELIGHYGYDYPERNTLRFRIATQALIWETISGQTVKYYTELYEKGDYINIDYERNIIMESVNKHFVKPSFNSSTVNATVGQEIMLEDFNLVLSDYEIYNSDNLNVRFEGNNVYVTPLKIGNLSLKLTRKHYDSFTTIILHGSDNRSQKMGYFRFYDPVVSSLKIESIGGTICITKKDYDNKTTIPVGDAMLIGAIYDVFDSNDNLVDTLTIGDNNKAQTIQLPLGKYRIKERTSSTGYTLDKNIYEVNINLSNLNIELDVFEKVTERNVTFFKVFATNETGIMIGEPNIKFKFTLKSTGQIYEEKYTDSNGYLSLILPYGTYTVSQETTTPNYEKIDNFDITINNEIAKPLYKLLGNAEITARLRVIKVDEDNNIITMKGIKFKIKNLDTNTYVEQIISYPEKQTISVFETSSDGTILTPFPLSNGNYELEEVENQIVQGFIWNKETIKFSVGDNSNFIFDKDYGSIIEIKFANKRIYGEFYYEKLGEKLLIEDKSFTYEEINLKDVSVNIYANEDIYYLDKLIYKKDDLVGTLAPQEIIKLNIGKYYLIETKTEENHVLNEKPIYFEINQTNQYDEVIKVNIIIKNYLKKGVLNFTKIDLNTNEALPNTKIRIFTENNEIIFEGITHNEGKIVIDNLFVGKFYILESEAPEGYILNTEKLWFEIKEDGQIIKCELPNEKIILVPNTGMQDYYLVEIISGVIILIGIGVVVYAIKYKKNKK